jgi:hypothetical protein
MPDAGCRMPDAGCRMPDAGCRMPDAGCRMPDARCPMQFGWSAVLGLLAGRGVAVPRPRPRFVHWRRVDTAGPVVIASYHLRQQNTGCFTKGMLDSVLVAARRAMGDLG